MLYAIWNFHTPLFASHPAFPRISFQVLDESLLAFACRLVIFNRTLGVENLVGWANQFRHCGVSTRINALHPEHHTWKQYKSLFRNQESPFACSCQAATVAVLAALRPAAGWRALVSGHAGAGRQVVAAGVAGGEGSARGGVTRVNSDCRAPDIAITLETLLTVARWLVVGHHTPRVCHT